MYDSADGTVGRKQLDWLRETLKWAEKQGFRQVGLRKNYYRNPKEDAMILRKEWDN